MIDLEDDRLAVPIEDAARLLGVGRTLVWAEVRSGRLPTIRIAKRRLVTREALERYIADRVAESEQ